MPQILPDDEIAESMNSFNSKQREVVFNVVYAWVKDYVKCDGFYLEPIQIFLSGRGGTGISHLVSLYHCKDPEKAIVLLFGPKGISVVKTNESIIHSGLGIKHGTKILGLNEKSKAALRNRSSEEKF